jgi:DNA-binding GntR family transcriptional regulator
MIDEGTNVLLNDQPDDAPAADLPAPSRSAAPRTVRKTHADVVFEAIDAAILDGQIAPGSKLTEQQLATHFGISRGPLREAINRLEGRGLIERTPHAGVRVLALSEADLREIYDMREVLEGLACRLAALHMSEREIGELQAIVDKQRSVADHLPLAAAGIGHGWDVHWQIVQGTRSTRLIKTICDGLYYRLRIYRNISRTTGPRAPRAVEEHAAIVDAIARRQPDQAEMLMRWHIRAAYAHMRPDAAAAEPLRDSARGSIQEQ